MKQVTLPMEERLDVSAVCLFAVRLFVSGMIGVRAWEADLLHGNP
jgi:hypothetical protein